MDFKKKQKDKKKKLSEKIDELLKDVKKNQDKQEILDIEHFIELKNNDLKKVILTLKEEGKLNKILETHSCNLKNDSLNTDIFTFLRGTEKYKNTTSEEMYNIILYIKYEALSKKIKLTENQKKIFNEICLIQESIKKLKNFCEIKRRKNLEDSEKLNKKLIEHKEQIKDLEEELIKNTDFIAIINDIARQNKIILNYNIAKQKYKNIAFQMDNNEKLSSLSELIKELYLQKNIAHKELEKLENQKNS